LFACCENAVSSGAWLTVVSFKKLKFCKMPHRKNFKRGTGTLAVLAVFLMGCTRWQGAQLISAQSSNRQSVSKEAAGEQRPNAPRPDRQTAVSEPINPEAQLSTDSVRIIQFARKYLGAPYRSSGDTPKGFDCSGFIWFVYHNAVKIEVPRSSRGIWTSNAKTVSLENARPGDIIVFSANKGGKGSINHTAILLDKPTDANPSGAMIHAVSDGPNQGILISPLDDKFFAPRIVGVKSFF
jgi:cell wall-associated NlpC family hydrolase